MKGGPKSSNLNPLEICNVNYSVDVFAFSSPIKYFRAASHPFYICSFKRDFSFFFLLWINFLRKGKGGRHATTSRPKKNIKNRY
jgi:hypothetical protein